MANRWETMETVRGGSLSLLWGVSKITADGLLTAAMELKDACSLEEKL